jgi:hypothetical protein
MKRRIVRAKRAGWNEKLSAEQQFDMEPYAEHGYESDDLYGELEIVKMGGVTVYLVDGQEADPDSIR